MARVCCIIHIPFGKIYLKCNICIIETNKITHKHVINYACTDILEKKKHLS